MPAVLAVGGPRECRMILVTNAGAKGNLIHRFRNGVCRGVCGEEVSVTVVELCLWNRCRCKGNEDVRAFEKMILYNRLINLIHELGFVFGVGARRVKMFWFTREGVVIDVATGFVGAIRIVGTSS